MIIRNTSPIKSQSKKSLLTISDQILVSIIDGSISSILFFSGLALILSEQLFFAFFGFLPMTVAIAYPLLRNVFFRSLGCVIMHAQYTLDDNGNNFLKLRVLAHNLISVSPILGAILYEKLPILISFMALILFLNFFSYLFNPKRIIDNWLHLAVVKSSAKSKSSATDG